MTRREVFRGIAGFVACVRAFGKTPQGKVLVVVRLVGGHSDLLMLRNGVEIARVRIRVLAPDIVNDVELAECMRLGLKAMGEGDMPILVAEESEYVKGFAGGLQLVG
jgi:hypothetical protein